MDIFKHEPDSLLECFYKDCLISLVRAKTGQYNSGMWYLEAKDGCGNVAFDDWITPASTLTMKNAFEFACDSLGVEADSGVIALNDLSKSS